MFLSYLKIRTIIPSDVVHSCSKTIFSTGYNLTAQRQLFGGPRPASGSTKVNFRDSFGANQNPYKWIAPDAKQQQGQGQSAAQQTSATDIV